MLRRLAAPLALVCLVLALPVSAHEIKVLASQQLVAEAGTKTTIYLAWGHRLPVDDLVDATTLERYELIGPGGKTALEKAGKALQTNVVELKDEGLYQVVVARKPSVHTYVLDAEGNRQLKRGPKSAQAEGKIDSATRSLQCGKAILVVGKPSEKAPEAVGQAIEIVPLDGPAKWALNSTLRFHVLKDGKPVPGAEVVARYVGFKPDNAWNYSTTSDPKGEFTIKPSHPGTWVLKAQSKQLTQGKTRDEYDFESFTATLSLEVAP